MDSNLFIRLFHLPKERVSKITIVRKDNLYKVNYMDSKGLDTCSDQASLRHAIKFALNIASFKPGTIILYKHHILKTKLSSTFTNPPIIKDTKGKDINTKLLIDSMLSALSK